MDLIETYFNYVSDQTLDSNYIVDDYLVARPKSCKLFDALPKNTSRGDRSLWEQWLAKPLNIQIRKQAPWCVPLTWIHTEESLPTKAIDDVENSSMTSFKKVKELLERPFDDWPGDEAWYGDTPDWAQDRSIQMNSCSSWVLSNEAFLSNRCYGVPSEPKYSPIEATTITSTGRFFFVQQPFINTKWSMKPHSVIQGCHLHFRWKKAHPMRQQGWGR